MKLVSLIIRFSVRLIIIAVIVSAVVGISNAYNGDTSTGFVEEEKELSTEVVDTSFFDSNKSTNVVDNEDTITEQTEIVDNTEEKENILIEETKNKTTDVSLKDNMTTVIDDKKQENVIIKNEEKNEIEVKEQEDNIQEDEKKIIEEVITHEENKQDEKQEEITEDVPIVDEEYERLKKIYKYKTSADCHYAALRAYSKTYKEYYQNANCISGAYNGELLGYRIIINFIDGTSMYYDEAI